jgi:hypothetical protein
MLDINSIDSINSYNSDEYHIILKWWYQLQQLIPYNICLLNIVSYQHNIPSEVRDELFNWIDIYHPINSCECYCCQKVRIFMSFGINVYHANYCVLQCIFNNIPVDINALHHIKNSPYTLTMNNIEFSNFQLLLENIINLS